jgi:hypothetical protein
MPSTITYNRFYPKLERVIGLDNLPDTIPQVLKDAFSDTIGQLYYKDLQIHKSPHAGADLKSVPPARLKCQYLF